MTTGIIDTLYAKERIAVAVGVALLTAGLVFVMFVLPAEYAVDPLGTGARVGLLELGNTGKAIATISAESARATGQSAVMVAEARSFNSETVDFKIPPHQFMEYKYRLDKGKALLFSWSASSPVNYELHAEPDQGPKGYAESYEKGDGRTQAAGTLTPPFAGIHGWYWENPGDREVTVSLNSAGFYTVSHEFRKDTAVKNRMFN